MSMNAVSDADLVWSDALLLGYEPMDAVHEEFVDVVNRLLNAPDAELLRHLDEFFEHAEQHFGLEDRWMTETGFPPRDCHMAEHAAVLKSAREVREYEAAGNTAVARSFAAELARWFPGHADYLDSALAQWMFKRQHGGKPLVFRRNVAAA